MINRSIGFNWDKQKEELLFNRKRLKNVKEKLNHIISMYETLKETYKSINKIFWRKRKLRRIYKRNKHILKKFSKKEQSNFQVVKKCGNNVENDFKSFLKIYNSKRKKLKENFKVDLPEIKI